MYSHSHSREDGVQGWNPWLGALPHTPFDPNVLSPVAAAIKRFFEQEGNSLEKI